MTNLMLINESITSGFSVNGLNIISLGAIISGILVITATNPLISVLFLIALFVNIAGYLIVLGINFIGLAYITVYVGAIAILFLFVIFLLDIKLAELHQDNNSKSDNAMPLAIIIGVGFLSPLYSIIPSNITEAKSLSYYIFNWFNSLIMNFFSSSNYPLTFNIDSSNYNGSSSNGINESYNNETTTVNLNIMESSKLDLGKIELDSVFTNLWDGNYAAFSQISSIGNVMYSSYILWFFISAIILLLAMIAAISLTFKPAHR